MFQNNEPILFLYFLLNSGKEKLQLYCLICIPTSKTDKERLLTPQEQSGISKEEEEEEEEEKEEDKEWEKEEEEELEDKL